MFSDFNIFALKNAVSTLRESVFVKTEGFELFLLLRQSRRLVPMFLTLGAHKKQKQMCHSLSPMFA